jgi:hypothetical protein
MIGYKLMERNVSDAANLQFGLDELDAIQLLYAREVFTVNVIRKITFTRIKLINGNKKSGYLSVLISLLRTTIHSLAESGQFPCCLVCRC